MAAKITNGVRMPRRVAIGPASTGPISAPTLPKVIATASERPRRSRGVWDDNQASPAVHEMPEAMPCPARAASSIQKLSAPA